MIRACLSLKSASLDSHAQQVICSEETAKAGCPLTGTATPRRLCPSIRTPASTPQCLHPAVCVATEGACLPASAPPPIAAPSQAPRTHTKNYLSTPFSDTFDELSQYKWVDSTLGNHI